MLRRVPAAFFADLAFLVVARFVFGCCNSGADAFFPIQSCCSFRFSYITGKRPFSILEHVEKSEIGLAARDTIIVRDHAAGEIADFVVIEPSARHISFLHCKGSSGPQPSARVGDCYEVLGQAIRNIFWVKNPRLMNTLIEHVSAPRRSPIVNGSRKGLERLGERFASNEWSYSVGIVQPGLSLKVAPRRKNVADLFVATYQFLRNQDAELQIICNE